MIMEKSKRMKNKKHKTETKKQTQNIKPRRNKTKKNIKPPPFSELGDAKQRTNSKMEIAAKK